MTCAARCMWGFFGLCLLTWLLEGFLIGEAPGPFMVRVRRHAHTVSNNRTPPHARRTHRKARIGLGRATHKRQDHRWGGRSGACEAWSRCRWTVVAPTPPVWRTPEGAAAVPVGGGRAQPGFKIDHSKPYAHETHGGAGGRRLGPTKHHNGAPGTPAVSRATQQQAPHQRARACKKPTSTIGCRPVVELGDSNPRPSHCERDALPTAP